MKETTWQALKRKIFSRKFFMTFSAFVSATIVLFGGTQEVATQVAALIMQGGAVIAYVFTEGWVDASYAGASGGSQQETETPNITDTTAGVTDTVIDW